MSDTQQPADTYPRLRVNPDLVRASREAGMQRDVQARLTGFNHISNLVKVLHAGSIVATPMVLERVETLARLVGFDGPLFVAVDETEPVGARA